MRAPPSTQAQTPPRSRRRFPSCAASPRGTFPRKRCVRRKDFRDGPSSKRIAKARQLRQARAADPDCARTTCRSRCRDRARCVRARRRGCRRTPPVRRGSPEFRRRRRRSSGLSCMVCGVPCMCMRMRPAPEAATVSIMAASPRRAVTSLTMSAPAASASRATAALLVSMEIGRSLCARMASMTGTTRRHSSAASTGSEPGRVDSPPMSMRSAPWARHFERAFDGAIAVMVAPAVAERVGRDVQDAHDERGAGKVELATAAAPACGRDGGGRRHEYRWAT
jgi:hypothetical protein